MRNKDTDVFKRDSLTVKRKEKGTVRMAISIIVFTALSFALCYFRFSIPHFPKFLTIDFSAFTELLAAIAYGPIIAGVICILKTALHMALVKGAVISDTAMLLVELVFVLIAGYYYHKTVFSKKHKNQKHKIHRRKVIIKGGFMGMLPALIIQFVLADSFVFPMLYKYYRNVGYSYKDVLFEYNSSLHNFFPDFSQLTSIRRGILIFNIPTTFVKLTVITLLTAFIYPIISPYLHFRKKG